MPRPCWLFFRFALKPEDLKTTHNTFRDVACIFTVFFSDLSRNSCIITCSSISLFQKSLFIILKTSPCQPNFITYLVAAIRCFLMFPGNLSGKGSPSIYFHFFLERMPSYLQVSSKGAVDISKKEGGKWIIEGLNPYTELPWQRKLPPRKCL